MRVHVYNMRYVLEAARSDWATLRAELIRKLSEDGYLRADTLATALIEDARARAAALVSKHLGNVSENLVDKVAKYMIAFYLAEN